MAFRADESASNGYERAKSYLVSRNFSPEERARSEKALLDIIEECGPVVDGYPTWHPWYPTMMITIQKHIPASVAATAAWIIQFILPTAF